MSTWNQDRYQEAWHFAAKMHNNQTLPGQDIPYLNHLGLVAMEAMAVVAFEKVEQPDLLVLCAVLHDVIEDTQAKFDNVEDKFGSDIAKGVMALTKDTNLPTKSEQMQDSINRIKQQPKEIWMVKLCDRITNLQPPPKQWNKAKIAAYQKEATQILQNLGEASPYLSERLAEKIFKYDCFL